MIATREQLNELLRKIDEEIRTYDYGLPMYDDEKMLILRELIRTELGLEGNEATDSAQEQVNPNAGSPPIPRNP
jgi:hypothetical protein